MTIQDQLSEYAVLTRPPQIDFTGWKYAIIIGTEHGLPTDEIMGPNSALVRVVTASAAQQLILPITPPRANATYDIKFFGPAVDCVEPPSTQYHCV